ncbi:class I SAM-dependent methyltransferase [Clostridium botulinum]
MYNILVFGTGSGCERMIKQLDMDKTDILAFIDNDLNKHNTIFYTKKIISPMRISEYEFDYIIVSSEYYKEIITQLKDMNIDEDKIITWYYHPSENKINCDHNNKVLNKIINTNSTDYFLKLKDEKSLNIHGKNTENILSNIDAFKSFDKHYYNEKYLKEKNIVSVSYCEKVIDNLLDKCNIKREKHNNLIALDIGCSEGHFSEAIRRKGFFVHGIDYSEVAIENARSRFRQCDFSIMDATNPIFNKEKFDFLFMRGLSLVINTHNLYFIKKIIDRYYNFTNDDGIFIFSSSTNFTGEETKAETVNLTLEEIRKLGEMVKFRSVDIVYVEEEIKRIKQFNDKIFCYLILRK